MRLSRADALSLLEQWMIESTPVSGSVSICELDIWFSGFLSEVTRHGFKIARTDNAQVRFIISVRSVAVEDEGHEYRDIREAPAEIRSAIAKKVVSQLILNLHHSGSCVIYERVP